jgi:EmrB/QacA subfamily drug resistance transporter
MIDRSQRQLALLVAGCFFMENLDGTMVTTSAPKIAADLHAPISSIGLVVTAYLVTLAVLIPLSGWLVERFGVRVIFLTAITVFTLASLLCATSVDVAELVVMRVLQGIGGAMMVPVGRLAVLGPAAKADIMRLIAYIVWPGLVAPVLAPLAGGLITTYAGWRWLFLINVPLGVIALLVGRRIVAVSVGRQAHPLDVAGVVLLALGLGGATSAATLASGATPNWPLVAVVGTTALALLAVTGRHLRTARYPVIDLSTLRIPTYRNAITTGFLFYVAMSAVPFLLPLLFETVFGWSAIKAGALVLCLFAGNIAIKPAAGPLLRRWGFRTVLVTAGATLAATMVGLGFLTDGTPLILIAVLAVLSGIARSLGGTAYNTLVFSDVPEAQMTHANSLSSTTTQLSLGLGVAAATVALRLGVSAGSIFSATPGPAVSYTVAFGLLAVLALAAALGTLRLPADAGAAVRA